MDDNFGVVSGKLEKLTDEPGAYDLVVDSEINKYLADKETYSTSILGYWKKASAHYPYLSGYANKGPFLSVPSGFLRSCVGSIVLV